MKAENISCILKRISNKPLPVLSLNNDMITESLSEAGPLQEQEETISMRNQEHDFTKSDYDFLDETTFANLKQSLFTFATNELNGGGMENQLGYDNIQNMFSMCQKSNQYHIPQQFCDNKVQSTDKGTEKIDKNKRKIPHYIPYNLRSRSNSIHYDNDGFKIPQSILKHKSCLGNRKYINKNKVLPKTPKVRKDILFSTTVAKLQTPVTLTPLLMTLVRESPSSSGLCVSKNLLSTPAIVDATKPPIGVPDFLSIIEDDSVGYSGIDNKLNTFDEEPLADSNVTDYILEVTDDYTGNCKDKNFCIPPSVNRLTEKKSKTIVHERGRHCKQLPENIEKVIKKHHKENYKRKGPKRKSFCMENTEEFIQRRVQSSCRRTRSLIKAAQNIGVNINNTSTNDEE